MKSEKEEGKCSTPPKLAVYSMKGMALLAIMESHGTPTPPHQSSLSVPFRWEQEPGKPLPCLSQSNTKPRTLELPPRLITVLHHGPYVQRSQRFHSSSFRKLSYVSSSSSSSSPSPPPGGLVLSNRRAGGFRVKGLFGSWSRRVLSKGSGGGNNKEASGGSYVFPSYGDGEEEESVSEKIKISRIPRLGSFSTIAYPTSHFWANIYEGLKQAVPWKNKKWNDRVI